ncbi:hypothetical protein ACFL1X_08030, partial [Candidatus Hydrogenedentota bacterium]
EEGAVDPDNFPSIVFEICSGVLEQFVFEIRRSMDYFTHQRRGGAIEEALILGEDLPKGLGRYLSAKLGKEIISGDAFAGAGIDPGPLPRRSGFVVAVGGALREDTI